MTHLSSLPEYRTWINMKTRCYDKNTPYYKNYGARGIKVCNRWINSFENFYKDMGTRPDPKSTLDRIDTNGDYTPKNCRWSSMKTQIRTRRTLESLNGRKCTSKYRGVFYKNQNRKYVAQLTENYEHHYLGIYEDEIDAAKAYDKAALKYFKEDAILNFPKEEV